MEAQSSVLFLLIFATFSSMGSAICNHLGGGGLLDGMYYL